MKRPTRRLGSSLVALLLVPALLGAWSFLIEPALLTVTAVITLRGAQ